MLRTLLLISFCTAFWAGAQNNIELSLNAGGGVSFEQSLQPDGSRSGINFQKRRGGAFEVELGARWISNKFQLGFSAGKIIQQVFNQFEPWVLSLNAGYGFQLKDCSECSWAPSLGYSYMYSFDNFGGVIANEFEMHAIKPGLRFQYKFLQFQYDLYLTLNKFSTRPYAHDHPDNHRRISTFKIGAFYKIGK